MRYRMNLQLFEDGGGAGSGNQGGNAGTGNGGQGSAGIVLTLVQRKDIFFPILFEYLSRKKVITKLDVVHQ